MLLNNKLLQRTRNNLIAIAACLLVIVPVYVVIVNSFKDSTGARTMSAALPEALLFENYTTVVERGKLTQTFLNSMLYATSATIISTILAAMTAYVLSRNKTRLNRFVYFCILSFNIHLIILARFFHHTQAIHSAGLYLSADPERSPLESAPVLPNCLRRSSHLLNFVNIVLHHTHHCIHMPRGSGLPRLRH